MDAQAFWDVIGAYNAQTWAVQMLLLAVLASALLLSYTQKVKWAAKFALGLTNLFIGIVFFAWYGTEPIQKLFALPLYLLCGGTFLYESRRNRDDGLERPGVLQGVLLSLYGLYPAVSMLFGNAFPRMVTYIMPCPVVSLSIVVYGGYGRKNRMLLGLLTVWGLTGIKSVFFNAYEDMILLVCGLYGAVLFVREMRRNRVGTRT